MDKKRLTDHFLGLAEYKSRRNVRYDLIHDPQEDAPADILESKNQAQVELIAGINSRAVSAEAVFTNQPGGGDQDRQEDKQVRRMLIRPGLSLATGVRGRV
jgi:hypothetical protein